MKEREGERRNTSIPFWDTASLCFRSSRSTPHPQLTPSLPPSLAAQGQRPLHCRSVRLGQERGPHGHRHAAAEVRGQVPGGD